MTRLPRYDPDHPYWPYTWLWWLYLDARRRYLDERRRAQALAAILRIILTENAVQGAPTYWRALEELACSAAPTDDGSVPV